MLSHRVAHVVEINPGTVGGDHLAAALASKLTGGAAVNRYKGTNDLRVAARVPVLFQQLACLRYGRSLFV